MRQTESIEVRPSAPDGHGEASRISVIMIFLNVERFIEEAIESVLAQSWRHWELLLVDDGSTDRSTTIACDYAARHPERVRYLEHPGHANRGMSASRKLGLAHAHGVYIAFLDADDAYHPDRLLRHAAILDAQPYVDMVQCTQAHWYSWKGNGEKDHVEPSIGPLGVISRPPLMLCWALTTQFGAGTCSLTIRREALAEVGGFEESFVGFCEDLVFKAKIYATKNTFVIDECLARYRRHPESVTLSSRGTDGARERSEARQAYFLWLKSFLQSRMIDDPWFDAEIDRHLRLERERAHAASRERLPLKILKLVLSQTARAVMPSTVRVRRVNQRRARQWQDARAEVGQLRHAYETLSVGRCPEGEPVQAWRQAVERAKG